MIKICKNCGRKKPINFFTPSENSDDGFHPICVHCCDHLKAEAEGKFDYYIRSVRKK